MAAPFKSVISRVSVEIQNNLFSMEGLCGKLSRFTYLLTMRDS